MPAIFGRKTASAFKKAFGKDTGDKVRTIGRKFVHTLDKVAPMAQTVATMAGRPDIAMAIGGANTLTQSGYKVATSNRKNLAKNLINFGDDSASFTESSNESKLLRQ